MVEVGRKPVVALDAHAGIPLRSRMVAVKPEELKILDGVANALRDAIKLARSTYDSKNLNAALVAAEFLLSHTLFTIEERKKV